MANDKTIVQLSRLAAQECIGFRVRRAARVVAQVYDDALAPLQIKGTQFSLLNAISLSDGPTISRLAATLLMDRTTLTRNLKPLQAAGLVALQPGDDRRRRMVRLTGAGQALLADALPLWRRAQLGLVRQLGLELEERISQDLGRLTEVARHG